MNTDNFLIEETDLQYAQKICKVIDDENVRNRAVANAVGAKIASKYFDNELYRVDSASGLHNIGFVLDDIDISDIYINNSYIDVRLFFDDEKLCVPREHFEKNILPVAYMFIRVSSDLSGCDVVGFELPENIDKSCVVADSYMVSEASLLSFYDVEQRLVEVEDLYNVEEEEVFDYLDNRLGDNAVFYQKLIKSKDGRLKLAKAANAKYVFQFISTVGTIAGKDETDIEELSLEEVSEPDFDASSDELFALADDEDLSIGEDFSDAEALQESEDNSGLESVGSLEELVSVEDVEDLSLTPEDEPLPEVEQDVIAEGDNTDIIEESFTVVRTEDDNKEDGLQEPAESSFENFTTNTTPGLEIQDDAYEELLSEDEAEETVPVENTEREEPPADEEDGTESQDNTEQIETLFNDGNDETQVEEDIMSVPPKNNGKASKFLAVLLLLLILAGGGYFGYTKFMPQAPAGDDLASASLPDNPSVNPQKAEKEKTEIQEAMPVETVNSTEVKSAENEGVAVSIPSIEQNLDASILVSNLKIDWEVPAGYASSTSAKRYLVKLGKIIQLNLKTELLLLNKPPLTNKIAVEIKFNNSTKKFETVGIITSSGEDSVDQLIKQTVDKALAMNLSINTNSFNKLQGNPILIIHL